MGSPLSGSFADIFMGHMEKLLFSRIPEPKSYMRYVDDTHVILNKNDEEEFFTQINQLHNSLKFTKEEGHHFLDVQIHIEDDRSISTLIYRKPTLTGLYTNYAPFCPKRLKINGQKAA